MIKNYVKVFEDGSQVATKNKPVFGLNNVRTEAGYNPDVYSDGKWYNSTNGSELVTNGTFDTDLSGWTSTGGWIQSGGSAYLNTSSFLVLFQTLSGLTVGKSYRLKFNVSVVSGALKLLYTSDNGLTFTDLLTGLSSSGTYTYDFVCQGQFAPVFARDGAAGSFNGYIDNVTCYETNIEPDTAYTTPQTYLPYVVNLDESGNVLDYDSLDIPTLVEDYVKADIVEGEHKGKNSCTAWVNFDGTATPPTIRDSYNVSQVIRTATGNYDIYFEEHMNNTGYTLSGISGNGTIADANVYSLKILSPDTNKTTSKVSIGFRYGTGSIAPVTEINVQIFGGKN